MGFSRVRKFHINVWVIIVLVSSNSLNSLNGPFNSDGKEDIHKKIAQMYIICNNKKRSHTQLDSRKQVIAFQDRVITINIKEAQHPLK